MFILGLFIGSMITVVTFSLISARSYDKGRADERSIMQFEIDILTDELRIARGDL